MDACRAVQAVLVSACAGITVPALGGAGSDSDPTFIGSNRQLFVDTVLVERTQGVSLRLHAPVRREVVFRFDAPWEGPQSAYVTVLRAGERFRMYYRGGGDLGREVTCMAESDDGIRWMRPSVGRYQFDGSTDNNIVHSGRKRSYSTAHNLAPFLDANPAADPARRWKAVALCRWEDPATGKRQRALAALVSADGIRWQRLREEPILTCGSFDSQNTAFWDAPGGRYVCYFRVGVQGKRAIARSTSLDFVHWSEPEPLEYGDAPLEHFYTNAMIPYPRAPGLYLGFPMRFVPERTTVGRDSRPVDALSDAVFLSSRDGVEWNRNFPEAFLRPGREPGNWGGGHGNNTPAWGVLQTAPDELSLYWSEGYGGDDGRAYHRTPRLRRGVVRIDGFASVHAGRGGGELVTRPLVFGGTELVVNYASSAVGSVRVELLDPEGRPIPGFRLGECAEIYGDEIARPVRWRGDGDLGSIAGRPICLRFVLDDADLYAFRFRP